jgi:beta-lysine 5,6-aminomutase alpha subunit
MDAISRGVFANISRPLNGGKGAEGVIAKEKDYLNPFLEIFKKELGIK